MGADNLILGALGDAIREGLEHVAEKRFGELLGEIRALRDDLRWRMPLGLLTKDQAAAWLGVSQRTLDSYVTSGLIECSHIGGVTRFKREVLEEVYERGVIGKASAMRALACDDRQGSRKAS